MYDFGDSWRHTITVEKINPPPQYPRGCAVIEAGERACPPEDVGGPYGYQEYSEAMANSNHERHKEFMEWQGPFDPEAFDAETTTKRMKRGLPNWRKME